MRHPRIPVGAAIVIAAVAATTASAFALSGNVPSTLNFRQTSASDAASTERATPTPTTPAAVHPASPPTSPVPPAPVVAPVHDDEPAPPASPPTTTAPETPPTRRPETPPPPRPPEPTTVPNVEHHEPVPTTAAPKPPTPTTAPTTVRPDAEEHPIAPTMTLSCGTGYSNGTPASSCGWTKADLQAFASYRLVRAAKDGPGKILFTTTDRSRLGYGDLTLVPGTTYTYYAQAMDASGHIIATSGPVVVTCCSSRTGQK